VNPDLLLPALWYFRWGALVTVLAGFGYFAMYILRPDVGLANAYQRECQWPHNFDRLVVHSPSLRS
jgi:hypothetical protein